MRYHNITKEDMLNGDGLRTVLCWLQPCLSGLPEPGDMGCERRTPV